MTHTSLSTTKDDLRVAFNDIKLPGHESMHQECSPPTPLATPPAADLELVGHCRHTSDSVDDHTTTKGTVSTSLPAPSTNFTVGHLPSQTRQFKRQAHVNRTSSNRPNALIRKRKPTAKRKALCAKHKTSNLFATHPALYKTPPQPNLSIRSGIANSRADTLEISVDGPPIAPMLASPGHYSAMNASTTHQWFTAIIDPAWQTHAVNGVPPRWKGPAMLSLNDCAIKHGNVQSPLFMIGLPCGGMAELAHIYKDSPPTSLG